MVDKIIQNLKMYWVHSGIQTKARKVPSVQERIRHKNLEWKNERVEHI